MEKFFNVIPTPQKFNYTSGTALNFKSIRVVGNFGKILKNALKYAEQTLDFKYTDSDADLTVFSGKEAISSQALSDEDVALFSKKFADEQGYVIKKRGEKIFVYAIGDSGCAYGIMTLLQLVGEEIGDMDVQDFPDFRRRGVKWIVWAETGGFSYDFGDGIEAMKKRLSRKIDMLFRFKINYVCADGFGFDAERFEGYSEVMRHLCDYARDRGIVIAYGGYSMSYGMVGHLNSYQGKHFLNRLSYPDGEVYDCIGTYEPKHPGVIKAPNRATCLSNDALTHLKADEMCDFVRKTHATELALHNMDADEIYPELWAARCDCCRKRWPDDSLYSKNGCAGAFAEFIDTLIERIGEVKDGDFDAARDFELRMASPGYLYAEKTSDEVFDMGIEFWGSVAKYLRHPEKFGVGFREQFFYHEKPVRRVEKVLDCVKDTYTKLHTFCGADGFYDDKIFTPTATLNYILKGYDDLVIMNGNSFQEPLAVFNSEYLWNSEGSAFYNAPRPDCYENFVNLYKAMLKNNIRPDEIYGDGGLIDVICEKLYGKDVGKAMSRVTKLSGKNGEPPIACAANVDIYTNYTRVVYPMRWNVEMSDDEIKEKTARFSECARVSAEAYEALRPILDGYLTEAMREDIGFICDAFYYGKTLCSLLFEYMGIYSELSSAFASGTDSFGEANGKIDALLVSAKEFYEYNLSSARAPLDKFEGPYIRRTEMAEFVVYNLEIMKLSVEQKKRIPDGIRPDRTRDWW